jgi:NAD(P)H dehydrogenase (quinone)
LETAKVFGARVAAVTARWIGDRAAVDNDGHQPASNSH